MSAFELKRTLGAQDCCCATWPLNPIPLVANPCCNYAVGVVLSLEEGDATTRFHQRNCRFDYCVAACRGRAAARAKAARCGTHGWAHPREADGQAEVDAFEEGLKGIGWKLGGNIELDYRWPGAELAQVSVAANEIVAMRPDLVVSRSTPATAIMLNRGLPIVFVLVADPISSGFVQNLGHPGGSVTGFSIFETSVGGKWLGLLKEAAPTVSRVSLLFNPETAPFADGYLHSAQAAAPTLGATVIPAPCGSIADIEGAFAARAHEDAGGIIIINDTFLVERRHLITEFATRYRLPTIYATQIYVPSGGLISYAADNPDILRRAASYVDRILRGARPGDLPVQEPAKFTLSINLKAARAIGLDLPQSLITRADEVIE
jgi:putative tryptophan/tyrosine transport system substrate-binding protein